MCLGIRVVARPKARKIGRRTPFAEGNHFIGYLVRTKPLSRRLEERSGRSVGGALASRSQRGGPCDPTTSKDVGRTRESKITALVLGWVEDSGVRSDSRGDGGGGSSSKCEVASIVW